MYTTTFTKRGKKYFVAFMTIILYSYIYFLYYKGRVLEKLETYKSKVKLHTKIFIKYLKSDSRIEYYDPDYFESIEIVHEIFAP